MMYLAPRQGLFAIILLVSCCLHTLLMVVSVDRQVTRSLEQKGNQMLTQLIDEAKLSLENKDRVSLSVIANRYTSEQDVASLLIKDNKDNVLVPIGNAPLQRGDTITKVATNGDTVVGSVSLTLKDISKGEILAMQWPFVIGTMIFHLLLWIAYGFVARPTSAQIKVITQQSSKAPINKPTENRSKRRIAKALPKSTETAASQTQKNLNAYLRAQQSAHESPTRQAPIEDIKSNPTILTQKLSNERPCDSVDVQIVFHDEYRMLKLLTPDKRKPYLALCSQLLQTALHELLKLPLLTGVHAQNEPEFSGNRAVVRLSRQSDDANIALAGVMLGKLYLMLNKIIYEKHVELGAFALPVKVGVSDSPLDNAMMQLINTVGKKEQLLVLVPAAGLKQIGNYVSLRSVSRPTNAFERQCAVFDGGNLEVVDALSQLRDAVLLSENTEQASA